MQSARPTGRGSMIAAVKAEERPAMRAPDGTVVDYFKLRVAAQQFMNDNGPLFAAFAREADAPREGDSHDLAEAIEAATALATVIARRFTGKADPQAQHIRPFRRAAAEIVAATWREDGVGPFDIDHVAEQHAAAFAVVDEDLDRNLFTDHDFSAEGSLAMTAAAVTLSLMRPVMVYDFRRDRAELVGGLSTTVMAMAGEATRQIVPESAKPDERRSLLQTVANRLTDIMAAIYERKSRQVIAHIGALPEAEREAFCRRYDPMPELIRTFREWGVVFSGTALAVARAASGTVAAGETPAAPRA